MTYLQFLISEAMGLPASDPRVMAVANALAMAKVIDEKAIKRQQIQNDPCRDYKIVSKRYNAPVSFVYRSWHLKSFPT